MFIIPMARLCRVQLCALVSQEGEQGWLLHLIEKLLRAFSANEAVKNLLTSPWEKNY